MDPGLAAHLLDTNATALTHDATLVGRLFETFVAAELHSHLETASCRTEMFCFRDRVGHEVDLILHRRGRFVALEVKSATSVGSDDAKHLAWLRDRLGGSFHLGVVLYTGQFPLRLGNRIQALPINTLWHDNR